MVSRASLVRLLLISPAVMLLAIVLFVPTGRLLALSLGEGALTLLSQIPSELLARNFLDYFREAYVWVRDRAIQTAVTRLPSFVPALLTLTKDPDAATARSANEMALSVPDARAIPVWLSLLESPDWWARHRSLERLGQFGAGREEVFERLVKALKEQQTKVSAAAALGDLADPRAAQPLLDTFKNSNELEDQLEILDALSRLGQKDARVAPMLTKISSFENLPIVGASGIGEPITGSSGFEITLVLPAASVAVAFRL